MSDHMAKFDDRNTRFELFDNKSMTEIVDLSAFDASDTEVSIDGSSNISNQERIAGFGDKEGGIFGFGAFTHIFFDSQFGSIIEGDFPGIVRFEGTDFEIGFFETNVLKLNSGEFTNP